jgi:D-glycero-alpha-D-manno-heptose-7-phosphate kinase
MLIVRSPVRISFAGGGTDLPAYFEEFGGAVLSTAINRYFYTILGKRRDGRVQVSSSDLRIFETWQDIVAMSAKDNELEIPLAVLKDLGRDIALDMFLASEIPPGTGLGSSASVCVGILRALTAHLQIPLSQYELAERSFHIVRNSLGRQIGKQDGYAAAFGGLNFVTFYRDGAVLVEPITLDAEIIVNCSPTFCCTLPVRPTIPGQFLKDSRTQRAIIRGLQLTLAVQPASTRLDGV